VELLSEEPEVPEGPVLSEFGGEDQGRLVLVDSPLEGLLIRTYPTPPIRSSTITEIVITAFTEICLGGVAASLL
jgi:hypothetical protein